MTADQTVTASAASRASAGWKRARLKHLCQDSGQYGLNVSANQYAAVGMRLVRTSDINEDGSLKSGDGAVYVDCPVAGQHILRAGDLLLSRSGTLGRSLLVPDSAAGATYAGYLVRFRPNREVEPRFLAYAAASARFQDTVRAEAVSSTIQNFNAERYANIALDVPPPTEQRRIADFLDGVSTRITRVCELRERQSTLIRTRFLNLLVNTLLANPESETWRPTRLKLLFEFERAGAWGDDPSGSTDDVVCVRVADFKRTTFRAGADATTRRSIPRQQLVTRVLRDGDVLLEKSGGGEQNPVGFAVSYDGDDRSVCSNFVSFLRPGPEHDPRFAALLMAAFYHAGRNIPFVKQTTGIQNLDGAAYLSQQVRVPDRRQQHEIATELDAHNDRCEALARAQHQQVALLTELRTAIITAALTGQIDATTGRVVPE
jgi:type I restriction enzyme S subunit